MTGLGWGIVIGLILAFVIGAALIAWAVCANSARITRCEEKRQRARDQHKND